MGDKEPKIARRELHWVNEERFAPTVREKPFRVWTLWTETASEEEPALDEHLVHGRYMSVEDEGHDWQIFLGKYRHASRVRDRSVWIVCEYLTATPEPVGDPIVLTLPLTAREVSLLRRELDDTEGSLYRVREAQPEGGREWEFWDSEMGVFRGLVEKLGGLRPEPPPPAPRTPAIVTPRRSRKRGRG